MDIISKIQFISGFTTEQIDFTKLKEQFMKKEFVYENQEHINEKQIFLCFFMDKENKSIANKDLLNHMEIAFQILINKGYNIIVTCMEQEQSESCKEFVNIFKDEAIQYVQYPLDSVEGFSNFKESKLVIVMNEESAIYPLILGKPFISLFNNKGMLEKLCLKDLLIGNEGFHAGVLLQKIIYIEEHIEEVEKTINGIFLDKNSFSSAEITNNSSCEDNQHQQEANTPDTKNEMEDCIKQFKSNIQSLIEQGLLKEAKEALHEYEKIVKDDVDINSTKGVIAMMEGDMDEAERVLKEGILVDGHNFDLLYNLAYCYQTKEDYVEAYEIYRKSYRVVKAEDVKKEINEILKNLNQREEIIKYKKRKKKLKIPVITIITKVYNSKPYIHECAKSVLNQSFTDFEWVVLDNGCTDGTSEILKWYAEKDKRIKLFRSKKNNIIYHEPNNYDFTQYIHNVKSEYMCSIDSDDYFHKDFLKELYYLAKQHNSDIAIGGTEMFLEKKSSIRGQRKPPSFYFNKIESIGDIFTQVYACFRPVWGKLVKTPIFIKSRENVIDFYPQVLNGVDTLISLDFLKSAKTIISIGKILHYYRIRNDSSYYSQLNNNRYLDYLIIYENSKNLLDSWNKFSDNNQKFISEVLYNSMKDCIEIAINSKNLSIEDRIEVVNKILSDKKVMKITNEVGLFISLLNDATKAIDTIVDNKRKEKI